jgi:energy-coupling factor transport system ATP-binding protein
MAPDPSVLLELNNWSLARRHAGGETHLLKNIDLRIQSGRWLAVLGANGSGKSSLLKFLASEDSPLQQDAAIMFQDPDDQIIASTVERELTLGREGLAAGPILNEFGLDGMHDMDPRLLSAGQKQRLVLAVALAGQPQVLLADEPTALQDPGQSSWILDRLRTWLSKPGRTLISATCDRREAALADELLVLEKGKVLLHGPGRDLLDDHRVVALLGKESTGQIEPEMTPGKSPEGPTLLHLNQISCRFRGPSAGFFLEQLNLHPGDRLGITGSNGCGKSTLLAACAGARKPDDGEVVLSGRHLYRRQSLDLDHGLAMLAPQFPEYLFTRETVAREIAIDPALKSFSCEDFLLELGLSSDLAQRNPHSLSSGQRRRLALGMVLFSKRPLLLLDEPTAALDRQGRGRVLELLAELPSDMALILASHDREFLLKAGCSILNLDDHNLTI